MHRVSGHRKGAETLRKIVRACKEAGVEYLTLYAFSTENWLRPKREVNALMELLADFLDSEVQDMVKNDIRLHVIGDTARLSEKVQNKIKEALALTSACRSFFLNLALSYGGREEILNAVRKIITRDREAPLDEARVDEEFFGGFLNTAGIPDPDLLIRTGREKRLSNFLLWQSAYTELYFTDVLWPDFDEEELAKAIAEYQGRKRRFGRVEDI